MKPSTAFTLGFLACYAIGAVLTYRALDVLAFKSLPATADALSEARRE